MRTPEPDVSVSAGPQDGESLPVLTPPGPNEPFYYAVASNLHRVSAYSRAQHLAIWRHVLDVYARSSREIPQCLRDLCHPLFVETLMGNDVFWGLAGVELGRSFYAEASGHLPAIYATAALLASQSDGLRLSVAEVNRLAAIPSGTRPVGDAPGA